jgi:hypothetical protein
VVLPAEHAYWKDGQSSAEVAARAILESRGNAPRIYRNTLVFLAVDKLRLQDLDEAVRKYLAWSSILEERVSLNLSPHQVAGRDSDDRRRGLRGGAASRGLPVASAIRN